MLHLSRHFRSYTPVEVSTLCLQRSDIVVVENTLVLNQGIIGVITPPKSLEYQACSEYPPNSPLIWAMGTLVDELIRESSLPFEEKIGIVRDSTPEQMVVAAANIIKRKLPDVAH